MSPEKWRQLVKSYRVTAAYVAAVVTVSLILQVLETVRGQ